MRVTSKRRIGFGVLAGVVALSGLSVPLLDTLAAPLLGATPVAASSGMTLVESPAVGSLSSLGGVAGYVASQDSGDVNGWLSGQGIDPAAAGPMTDATVPPSAADQVTSSLASDGSASLGLSADATGVTVGYAVGDAQGSAALTVGLSNLAPVSGKEGLQLPLTTAQRLQWWNGMKWTADVTASGTPVGSITFTWGPTGVTSTTNVSNASFASTVDQMASSMTSSFNGNQTSMLQLSSLLSSLGSVSSDSTSSVPYSFAYSVGSALTPGASVSVKPADVVSGSWLNGLNADQTGSGALSSVAVSSLLSPDVVKALPSLSGFDSLQGASSMADVTATMLTQLGADGKLDQAVGNAMFAQTDSQLASVASSMNGMLAFEPLDDAAKQVLVTNVHGLVPSLLSGGWATQVAQAASGSVELKSTLDPGTVTSLVPTGVTVAAPAETAPAETASPETILPTDAPVVEPTDTTPSEPTDTTVPGQADTAVPESSDTTVPQPSDTAVPEQTDTALPGSTDAAATEPSDTTGPESTDTVVPEQTDTAAPEPSHTAVQEPTDTTAPEPTDTTGPEPSDTVAPGPTDTTTESTDTTVPEQSDTTATEPSDTVVHESTDTSVPAGPSDTTATAPSDTTAPAGPTTAGETSTGTRTPAPAPTDVSTTDQTPTGVSTPVSSNSAPVTADQSGSTPVAPGLTPTGAATAGQTPTDVATPGQSASAPAAPASTAPSQTAPTPTASFTTLAPGLGWLVDTAWSIVGLVLGVLYQHVW